QGTEQSAAVNDNRVGGLQRIAGKEPMPDGYRIGNGPPIQIQVRRGEVDEFDVFILGRDAVGRAGRVAAQRIVERRGGVRRWIGEKLAEVKALFVSGRDVNVPRRRVGAVVVDRQERDGVVCSGVGRHGCEGE